MKKLSGVAKVTSFAGDLGKLGKTTAQSSIRKVNDLSIAAGKEAAIRLKNVGAVIKERTLAVPTKLAEGAIGAAKGVDETITNTKKVLSNFMPAPEFAFSGGAVKESIESTHVTENAVKYMVSKIEGLNIGGKGAGSGAVNHIDEVPRIENIKVNFNRNPKHNSEEFSRQLKDQEIGMNELTVDEYLKNRERYIAEGRAIEGNAAQRTAREKARSKSIEELFESGMSWEEAERKTDSWLKTQAALHNPDQIAGGNPLNIGGVGDKGVNYSIGAQWKYRIDIVDGKIGELAKEMTPEQLKITYLNIKFTH